MAATSASAAGTLGPDRTGRRRRLSTSGRLYVAFAALAAAFALAFALQLSSLDGIGRAVATMDELDEGKRLALELEHEVRGQFVREAHLASGDEAHFAGTREASARIAQLNAELRKRAYGGEAGTSVAALGAASQELERNIEEAIALVRASAPIPAHVPDAIYRLVFEVEESADTLITVLQRRDVEECAVVERVRRSTRRLVVGFLLAFPVLAVGFAAHLSRTIARPLRIIGDGAARIAAGDLGARVDTRGPEEFDALSSKVNAMAATLERDQEELVRSRTLARLGRMAAGIAHEINNPLQVMLGYLSLHRDRVPGELGQDLARVEQEATRCREIVSSLLQLARAPVRHPPAPIDLREVALDVAGALRMAMNGSVPALRVAGEGMALGSAATVRQILLNLARNAAEAAGPAGEVEIRVGVDGALAFASVTDTGPGVPPEHRDRVFDPFFTTKPTGTGLGLPIARSIAGALGGSLVLEPRDGGGARFTLRLPRNDGPGGLS